MNHSPSDWIPPEFETKRDEILEIAAKHGALNVRLFGPVGSDNPPADKNMFLVRLGPGRGGYDLRALKLDLRNLLDQPVDACCEGMFTDKYLKNLRRRVVPLEQ